MLDSSLQAALNRSGWTAAALSWRAWMETRQTADILVAYNRM